MRGELKALVRVQCLILLIAPAAWVIGCGDSTGPESYPPVYHNQPSCSDSSGTICTWAGTGSAAYDGDGNDLRDSHFYYPVDLTFTGSGAYILDWNNHRVRRVTALNTLETVIGADGVGDGDPAKADRNPPGIAGTEVLLNHPTDIVELPGGMILLTAWHNHKLRHYDPGTGLVYITCGGPAGFSGDDGPARSAQLSQPSQTVVGPDGSLYILDQRNQRVRRISPSDTIRTVVGTGEAGYAGDGGPPVAAKINMAAGNNPPTSGALAVDAQGRLYISDTLNHRIRRVDFGADIIETVAGNGVAGYGGDGGAAVAASLNNPRDIQIGPDGRLYIADEKNNRIRAVDLDTGIITTVAGTGAAGFGGDGGQATNARLNRPSGIAFDDNGYLYIADTFNHRIRRVSP